MGVVFRAHDHVRRIDVALKALRQHDGVGLFQFKHEFRALAGIVHRNLVTLYELQVTDDEWFFTMELIDGVSFLEHVRPHQLELEVLRASGGDAGDTLLAAAAERMRAERIRAPDKLHALYAPAPA